MRLRGVAYTSSTQAALVRVVTWCAVKSCYEGWLSVGHSTAGHSSHCSLCTCLLPCASCTRVPICPSWNGRHRAVL